MLPQDIRQPLAVHPQRASLLEVVLDVGRRPEARFLGVRGGEFLRDAEVRRCTFWLLHAGCRRLAAARLACRTAEPAELLHPS